MEVMFGSFMFFCLVMWLWGRSAGRYNDGQRAVGRCLSCHGTGTKLGAGRNLAGDLCRGTGKPG